MLLLLGFASLCRAIESTEKGPAGPAACHSIAEISMPYRKDLRHRRRKATTSAGREGQSLCVQEDRFDNTGFIKPAGPFSALKLSVEAAPFKQD
jgi:hypothetical protein